MKKQQFIEAEPTNLDLQIKMQNKQTRAVKVHTDWPAYKLKEAVSQQLGITQNFSVIFMGKVVGEAGDVRKISDFHFSAQSTLQLALKMTDHNMSHINPPSVSPITTIPTNSSANLDANYIVIPYDPRRNDLTSKSVEVELTVYKDMRDAEEARKEADTQNKKTYEDGQKYSITGVTFASQNYNAGFRPTNVGQWLQKNHYTAPVILEILGPERDQKTYYFIGNNQGLGEITIALVRDSDTAILQEIQSLKNISNLNQKLIIDPYQHGALIQKMRTLYSSCRREQYSICAISFEQSIAKQATCVDVTAQHNKDKGRQHKGTVLQYTALDTGRGDIPHIDFTKIELREYNEQNQLVRTSTFDTKEVGDKFRQSANTIHTDQLGTKAPTDNRMTFELNKETGVCEFRIYGTHARSLVDDNAKDIFSLDAVSYGQVIEYNAQEVGFSCVMSIDIKNIPWPAAFINTFQNKLKGSGIVIQPRDSNKEGDHSFRIDLTNQDDSVILCVIRDLQLAYSEHKQNLTPKALNVSPKARELAAKSWHAHEAEFKADFSTRTRMQRQGKAAGGKDQTTGDYWDSFTSVEARAIVVQAVISGTDLQQAPATVPMHNNVSSARAMDNLATTIRTITIHQTTIKHTTVVQQYGSSSSLQPQPQTAVYPTTPSYHTVQAPMYAPTPAPAPKGWQELKESLLRDMLSTRFTQMLGETAIDQALLLKVMDVTDEISLKIAFTGVTSKYSAQLSAEVKSDLARAFV